jgi:hypothetical protein
MSKNPQVNAILEHIHDCYMLCTSEIDMADSVKTSDMNVLTDREWAIRFTYQNST